MIHDHIIIGMQVMLATLAGKFAKLTRSQRWLEALQVWKQLQEVESLDRRHDSDQFCVW